MQPKQAHPKPFETQQNTCKAQNGEQMGSHGQIEDEIWQFVYFGDNCHTKQCKRAKMQPKQDSPKPLTMHQDNPNTNPDEEWQ